MVTFFDAESLDANSNRTIPTWWNDTVLREADKPQVSADGLVFTYTCPVDVLGLVVSVRGEREASAYEAPAIRALVPDVWKTMTLEIEWGFDQATAGADYSGRIEVYDGILSNVQPLAGDGSTAMEDACKWTSLHGGDGRRGVSLSLLYIGTSKWRRVWPYNGDKDDIARTIVTVRSKSGNFSFLAADLENGPVLAPEYGFFVRATQISSTPSPEAKTPDSAASVPKTVLDRRMDDILGNSDLRGWGTSASPWFAGNATDRPATVQGITVPSRSLAMHPGASCDVSVGWRSPIDGQVNLRANVQHVQPDGGDGIDYSLVQENSDGRKVLLRGTINRGGAQSLPLEADAGKVSDIAVRTGDVLSLVVGRRESHVCDSTAIALTIKEQSPQSRTWDLANDVVDQCAGG